MPDEDVVMKESRLSRSSSNNSGTNEYVEKVKSEKYIEQIKRDYEKNEI
jgi:hypothetical protein